jgi:hypothetical protein
MIENALPQFYYKDGYAYILSESIGGGIGKKSPP